MLLLLITSQSKEIDQGNLVRRWPVFEWRIVFGSKYLWERKSLLLDQRKYFWEWEKNISYGLKKIFKNEKKKCLNWKKNFENEERKESVYILLLKKILRMRKVIFSGYWRETFEKEWCLNISRVYKYWIVNFVLILSRHWYITK